MWEWNVSREKGCTNCLVLLINEKIHHKTLERILTSKLGVTFVT